MSNSNSRPKLRSISNRNTNSHKNNNNKALIHQQQRLHRQHADTIWAIEDVVDGPKIETVNGKKRKLYKVRWSESFELANNIPADMIDLYEKREKKQIKILGPLVSSKEMCATNSNSNNTSNSNAATIPASFNENGNNNTSNCSSISCNGGGSSIHSATTTHTALQKTKFAVEIGDKIEIMNYKQVKSLYKEELLEYFEERAKIEE